MCVKPVEMCGMPNCGIIGVVLLEMHRAWDEPHTPCCLVLPLSDEL